MGEMFFFSDLMENEQVVKVHSLSRMMKSVTLSYDNKIQHIVDLRDEIRYSSDVRYISEK
jgi:hypothetical protein